ncbi:CREB-regulated transcription coactivator 1-like isoform X7 [Vespa crabro]|nr:CREB-regulated transcription coactivator 1-like isoform X7 [Vespa crabro]XP_046831660.1 CREB-regulated transcription coactivator 1-like isoform X7 [Vespa crabro]XP_046831661.1 CREB-regulated transcription coactivator 1-like isoform X7 [Vespa crabro]XP_046831662.1 CREB-regulated transcription coactivator 1-like isoform X7 [Vespa crabro]XP_046831663.1 CREB-regulated transcription coactivator 1-like isoform X7 [Vespa crabro]XP_046831665.1 CREB-regulated transcription coactivator 1-like isoform
MANPRKFSEKIALLNQKEAQETAAFEAIMREVSDVTSRVASASSSVGASPTGSGVPDAPLSVKSAGASPPQSSGKHLHINLGNQFRAGGSLPNVNNNANCANDTKEHHPSQHTGAVHSIDLKTALSNLEEMQHNSMINRNSERGRHMGIGPVRPRPMEKRHDTSPYSGVSYLPLPDTWRRTNSDSALHQSANEACQSTTTIPHRRDQHNFNSSSNNDNRETHYGSIERPRSSCEMPRVPGINICLSSQPPGQQIPIGNNTGSLPDLSNVHFPSPLHTPLDQEDQSSSTHFSNSPQTSSPTNLSPTSLAQAGRLSLSQDHNPPSAQNHLSVPVNSRFLQAFKQGVALENSTSTSQQDLQNYSQQTAPQPPPSISHSPAGHYIYQQQPHSPVPPQSPKTSQSQQSQQQQQHQHQQTQQLNSLDSYRISQTVNRPSPQSSPSLTVQGSPLSYSNNPSAPPSPTGHPGPPTLASDGIDQNNYVINQAQAAALQQDFEQFTMDWPKFAQQLMELGCTWTTQIEMDTPVSANTIGSYIGSPNHTTSYAQNDMINVGGELGSGDGGYFSTSPQVAFQPTNTSTTTAQQLTPQTPNTPTIILTDFSGADDLTNPEFVKDLGTAMMSDFDPELFPTDDALRQGLGQIDVDGLQMLTDPTVVISDPSAEAHFRLDRL